MGLSTHLMAQRPLLEDSSARLYQWRCLGSSSFSFCSSSFSFSWRVNPPQHLPFLLLLLVGWLESAQIQHLFGSFPVIATGLLDWLDSPRPSLVVLACSVGLLPLFEADCFALLPSLDVYLVSLSKLRLCQI